MKQLTVIFLFITHYCLAIFGMYLIDHKSRQVPTKLQNQIIYFSESKEYDTEFNYPTEYEYINGETCIFLIKTGKPIKFIKQCQM